MNNILISIVIVATILIVAVWIIYTSVKILKNLATADRFFTIVNEPEIKVVLQGGIPTDCLTSVKGHTMIYYDNGGRKEDWTLVRNEELGDPWLKDYKKFKSRTVAGYFFYGILPSVTIAKTKIDAARWKGDPEKDIRSAISHEEIEVSSLRARTERRVVFQNVEVGGGSTLKIDVGFTLLIKLVHPLVAMFDRRGNFGEIVDESLKEIVTRETLNLTDDDIFASSITKPIFDPKKIFDELCEPGNNMQNSGYYVTALIYHGFELSPGCEVFAEAKAQAKMAQFKRQAQLEQAEADKKSRELEGSGRASAMQSQITALVNLGVTPDTAAHVFGRMITAEAVAGSASDIAMWIEQGAGIQFAPGMIPNNKKKTP